jgi:hypothetical protein
MNQGGEVGAVTSVGYLVQDQRIGLQDRRQGITSAAGVVAERDELVEMAGDMTFVPGVLVQLARPIPVSQPPLQLARSEGVPSIPNVLVCSDFDSAFSGRTVARW